MKIIVFGASGKMGTAVAWDLCNQEDVTTVGLVGRTESSLQAVRERIASDKIALHALDVLDADATAKLMRDYDVGVCTLPDRRTSYALLDTAMNTGFNLVDMLEEYHRRPDPYEIEGLIFPEGMTLDEYGDSLHELGVKNGAIYLDGIGFAPGLSNILSGEGIRKLDHADSVVARVGGIPSKVSAARHPLRYMTTWSFDHVLREYMIRLNIIRDGKIVEVDAATELERFRFTEFGVDEMLECAITPGMPSFIDTRPELKEFAEKTIRWPGHWEAVQTFKECGLLDLESVDFKGTGIVPREFLYELITPKLMPLEGDTDVCVMWNSVEGTKGGVRYRVDSYMWDEADTTNQFSSMARVTGYPAAISAVFIARGMINAKGIVAPEDCFVGDVYEAFMDELAKRDIHILERMTEIQPT